MGARLPATTNSEHSPKAARMTSSPLATLPSCCWSCRYLGLGQTKSRQLRWDALWLSRSCSKAIFVGWNTWRQWWRPQKEKGLITRSWLRSLSSADPIFSFCRRKRVLFSVMKIIDVSPGHHCEWCEVEIVDRWEIKKSKWSSEKRRLNSLCLEQSFNLLFILYFFGRSGRTGFQVDALRLIKIVMQNLWLNYYEIVAIILCLLIAYLTLHLLDLDLPLSFLQDLTVLYAVVQPHVY